MYIFYGSYYDTDNGMKMLDLVINVEFIFCYPFKLTLGSKIISVDIIRENGI